MKSQNWKGVQRFQSHFLPKIGVPFAVSLRSSPVVTACIFPVIRSSTFYQDVIKFFHIELKSAAPVLTASAQCKFFPLKQSKVCSFPGGHCTNIQRLLFYSKCSLLLHQHFKFLQSFHIKYNFEIPGWSDSSSEYSGLPAYPQKFMLTS